MAVSNKELEDEYRKRNEKVKLQVVALHRGWLPRQGHAERRRRQRATSTRTRPSTASASSARSTICRSIAIRRARRWWCRPPTSSVVQRQHRAVPRRPNRCTPRHILLKTEGKDEADGEEARRGAAGTGEGWRRFRGDLAEEGIGRRGIEGHRRRPGLLRQGADGAGVRDGGLRAAAGPDERAGARRSSDSTSSSVAREEGRR